MSKYETEQDARGRIAELTELLVTAESEAKHLSQVRDMYMAQSEDLKKRLAELTLSVQSERKFKDCELALVKSQN